MNNHSAKAGLQIGKDPIPLLISIASLAVGLVLIICVIAARDTLSGYISISVILLVALSISTIHYGWKKQRSGSSATAPRITARNLTQLTHKLVHE